MRTDKKNSITIAIMLLFTGIGNAQKPLIDSSVFDKWWDMRPSQPAISADGDYIFYQASKNLFLSSTDNRWKKEFRNIGSARFTQDGKKIIFQRNDSVFIIVPGSEDNKYINGVEGKIDLLPYGTEDNLLLYQLKASPGQLLVSILSTGAQHSFPSPAKYWFNKAKGTLSFLIKEQKDATATWYLKSGNIKDGTLTTIWEGENIDNLLFNGEGTACAFLSRNDKGEATIWYADLTMQSPVQLTRDHDASIEFPFRIAAINGFDKSGGRLYFTLTRILAAKKDAPKGVDVYNYKDPVIQSEQLVDVYGPGGAFGGAYTAMIYIRDKKVMKIEDNYAQIMHKELDLSGGKWVLIQEADKNQNLYRGSTPVEQEWNWNKTALVSLYLLSLENGKKTYLIKNVPRNQTYSYWLSPGQDYVVFYDFDKNTYCSYEIAIGVIKNITKGTAGKWVNPDFYDYPVISDGKYVLNGIARFSNDGRYVLLYDEYDIYKVDITGKEKPVDLTAGYGRSHHVVLRVDQNSLSIKSGEKILLSAFNPDTKENGFYSIEFNSPGKPDSLSMQPKKFETFGYLYPYYYIHYGKAKNAEAYLVVQNDERSFPNLYFSNDLKKFTAISDIHPEKNYNWLTTELVNYKLPDGRPTMGVLYKPENFDPHKKYPLILLYYERRSDDLHNFDYPKSCTGEIDIPYFVSNGYLVFTPDIHYTVGSPGRSALNSVVSAAQLLAKQPYVDAKKMGIQGMSFGGFETNYIVTHTNMFAAAMSSCGMTDFVSIYNSIIGDGTVRQRQYEIQHDRMGGSLWDIPGKYIENSPVLRADKITTPLLMMANDRDPDVPHQQGIELFTALRRLQKKAWMLQYDGAGHGVNNAAADDFTIRIFQFFNHYLKNAPAPKWMTEGVPAENKGLFTGIDLDYSGNKP